ncbi:pyruvate dehydrogenase kinase [Raphidocelis subcapitata]|uniref:Protein-serine/threonine kinase n=1 Tax=Raphidocelis subcapitata TaxID=307507 RepID=A0A2V0PFA8_9CHLO|nr:pyruvate dehydrogenase kinase [Raphidocelis subcapitata]|eukprot:GBF98531.1 pyruvate dehydrogenase kinase [Raphidocelis subcapitata]
MSAPQRLAQRAAVALAAGRGGPAPLAASAATAAAGRSSSGSRGVWTEPPKDSESARVDSFYNTTVETYAQLPITQLSLQRLLEGGRSAALDAGYVTANAREVQRELPRRLARRLLDLQLLPHLVVTNPHVNRVYKSYHHAFEVLRQLPPVASPADNASFCVLLRRLVDEHAPMLDSLAAGLREAKARALVGPALQLDGFFDSMLRSRITRRVLAEQHLAVSGGGGGVVDSALSVAGAAEFAGQRAAMLCAEVFGTAPDVRVTGDIAAVLPYIPSHLDYILYEVLKNAMRATVERHAAARLPPVQIRVCAGASALTVRISDQGGGIPEDIAPQVWGYGFTTSDLCPLGSGGGGASSGGSGSGGDGGSGADPGGGGAGVAAAAKGGSNGGGYGVQLAAASEAPRQRYKLAGLGFGLPLSRLYARYFGGELALQNMPGFGVDAYITLRDLEGLRGSWSERDQL